MKRKQTKPGTGTHTGKGRTRDGPGGPGTDDSVAGLRPRGVAKCAARFGAADTLMHGTRVFEYGTADYAARMVGEEVAAGVMVRGAVATGR